MDYFDEIDVEQLQEALDNVDGKSQHSACWQRSPIRSALPKLNLPSNTTLKES